MAPSSIIGATTPARVSPPTKVVVFPHCECSAFDPHHARVPDGFNAGKPRIGSAQFRAGRCNRGRNGQYKYSDRCRD